MAQGVDGDYSINTIIGPGTNLTGDIESGGFTRIDGIVRGDVKAKGRVVIGEKARMKGNVSGTNITIGGIVAGNIIADGHLIILSTALVIGDIITRRIQADAGCFINGKVSVCPAQDAWEKTKQEFRDEQGIRSTLPVFNRPLT